MKRSDLLEWAKHLCAKKPSAACGNPQILMWLCLFEWAGMFD